MSQRPSSPSFAAVEAGGTKFVCAIGSGPGDLLLNRARFPTGDDPAKAIQAVVRWLRDKGDERGGLAGIGIASFGPLDLDPASPSYGFITSTPKSGWRNTDIVGQIGRAFPKLPIGFDTDVNGAALGEWRWGAAQGLSDFVYVTAGTGLGGGGMARGRLLHGLVHPEMGHMGLPQIEGDRFEGVCPFHGRCWEGLCSGPAIEQRTGIPASELPADHPGWEITIRYMAHALVNLTCVLSPRRIIVGGSVRKGGRLGETAYFARLRDHFRSILAGYISSPALTEEGIGQFIVPPLLGDDAGVCGGFALAEAAMRGAGTVSGQFGQPSETAGDADL